MKKSSMIQSSTLFSRLLFLVFIVFVVVAIVKDSKSYVTIIERSTEPMSIEQQHLVIDQYSHCVFITYRDNKGYIYSGVVSSIWFVDRNSIPLRYVRYPKLLANPECTSGKAGN